MADKTVQINSFKYGLDTRREALASLPGTLQTAENVIVNSGGEVEKRKAFYRITGAFPSNTFGLQDTDSGLVTFGSDAAPVAPGVPSGVTYQRLQYPYNVPSIKMVAVLFSCCFLGKAFVLAQFDYTSLVFAYYNGVLVGQITDGIVLNAAVLTPETVSQLAVDLAAIVNRITGWQAHANVNAIVPADSMGLHEIATPGSVLVMSPPQIHFTPVIQNNNSVAGLLGARLIDQNYNGVAAIGASVAFKLDAGTNGTVTVTAPAKADGSGTAALSGGAVNFPTTPATLTQLAADVATAINNNTSITGYTAISSVSTVTVFAPPSFGNVTFNLTVVTTGNTTTAADDPGSKFVFYVNPTVVNSSNASVGFGISYAFLTASCSGNGGVVTYTWEMCNSDGTTANVQDSGIRVQPSGAVVGVALQYPHAAGASGYVLCTATDAGPPTVALTKVIAVTLPPPAAPPT